jgi:superfamily II DNA or RNA helicase
MTDTKLRRSRRFSWDEVDPKVARLMVVQVLRDHDRNEERLAAQKCSDSAAIASARSSLGEPPKPPAFTPGMIDLLRQHWLPTATHEVVDALCRNVRHGLSGDALAEPVGSNRAQIAFLRKRNMTDRLRKEFRSAFISAHKADKLVPVRPTHGGDPAGPVELVGASEPPRSWYPHQVRARHRLSELLGTEDRLRGLIVLPTGAGKTDTVSGWLLDEMAKDPALRVLWLVHQQELVDQALLAMRRLARAQPPDFARRGRAIHASASALTTLAEPDLDVVAMTYQAFRGLDAAKKAALRRFLQRPTIVVVDEAHHAASPSYDSLLELIESRESVQAVIGLTATPFPAGAARGRFHRRFPTVIEQCSPGELVQSGILARPIVTTVSTHEIPEMTSQQVAQASRSEIPGEVLQQLNQLRRNQLVVRTWLTSKDRWGKTLLFATRIDHANTLTAMLRKEGVDARALHSDTEDRGGTLQWFRDSSGPVVLVSVGMLTEGVDLPDANAAFLARPTTSPILMRQMVGRVLRGPDAGGSEEAEIVYFRDEWRSLPDVLSPADVLPEATDDIETSGTDGWTPGPIVDDEELGLRADLAAQIRRDFERLSTLFNNDDDDPFNDVPPAVLADATQVIGYFDLSDVVIPVFRHQRLGYERLLEERDDDFTGWAFLSYFEDCPPPYPAPRSVQALMSFAREFGPPELTPVAITVGPRSAAAEISSAGALTDVERFRIIERHFLGTANRLAFASVQAFEELVHQELARLRHPERRPLQAESALPTIDQSSLPFLPRDDRLLTAPTRLAVEGVRRLPSSYAARLDQVPPVQWTNRVVESTMAHWSLKPAGKGKGRASIRVNRLLRTTREHISDDMLGYLVYHELLHHILPSQGHDAEFRELEAQWPGAPDLDVAFDTLHERWDTRAESYPDDREW